MRDCELFTLPGGEVIEALRCPETGQILYRPFCGAIFEQHKTYMDLIGFKRPVMIPVFPAYTPSGKKLTQWPSLEDIVRQDIGAGFQPCKFGYFRKESTENSRALPQIREEHRVQFAVEPEPPDISEGMYLSYTSRTNKNAS